MKRFWHSWLAVAATVAMITPAFAQNDLGKMSEIGSYQSILSRAGYNNSQSYTGPTNPIASPPSATMQPASPGSGTHNVYGGSSYRGGQMNHQMMQGQVNAGPVGTIVQEGGMVQGGMVQQQQGAVVSGGSGCPGGCSANGGGAVYGNGYGGAAYGGQVHGGPMYGGSSYGGSVFGNASMGAAGGSSVLVNQGYVGNGGYAGDGYVSNGGFIDNGGYAGPGFVSQNYGYDAPVYSPGVYQSGGRAGLGGRFAGMFSRGGNRANRVFSIGALFLTRDYEDDRQLSYNPIGERLFTTQADNGSMSGLDIAFGTRNCNGRGTELRYWGLSADNDGRSIAGNYVTTALTGMSGVDIAGYTAEQVFNYGDIHSIIRDTEIHNLEFNTLRNGGRYTTRRGKAANFEVLGGLRIFEFDEHFRYISQSSFGGTIAPVTAYDVNVDNTLVGFQVGARSEICLSNKLRFAGATKLGLFNNHITESQSIRDRFGNVGVVNGGPNAGRDYVYEVEKDDIAMLGEIDLGLIYMLSNKARLRGGYRALGVAGVALAADQIPYDFTNVDRQFTASSNGNLLLHGGYFGMEFCY